MSLVTNGLPLVASYTPKLQLSGWERVPVDTYGANGLFPQQIGATAFDIAALFAAMSNAGTESANAITLNALGGLITTASLTTAVGSTYTITLTNSALVAGSVLRCAAAGKSNIVPGVYVVSVVVSVGSAVILLGNANPAGTALSGTCFVPFLVATQ